MPPITSTGMASTMADLRNSVSTARNWKGSPVTAQPRLVAIQEHRAMKPMVMMMPGTTPAMNMPPTDTEEPAMKAYTIIAPLGGMMGPRLAAAATMAVAKPLSYTFESEGTRMDD